MPARHMLESLQICRMPMCLNIRLHSGVCTDNCGNTLVSPGSGEFDAAHRFALMSCSSAEIAVITSGNGGIRPKIIPAMAS